eukprot:c1307_g1_i1.p1 GENE.c1307_g1_i1~~c1307_g1_i1.p1  ORF type:complete len:161 (-),score=34.58 c1307_g1_i1:36-518(-)
MSGHGHSHSHGHSCADEAHNHGHGHNDEHGNNAHDNSAVEGEEWSLFLSIKTSHLTCLNATSSSRISSIFKPRDKCLDTSQGFITSDVDPQLILTIPFTSPVNIRSICVVGNSRATSPASLKLFTNRNDIDFDNVESLRSEQTIELAENLDGRVEHPTHK